MKILDISVNPLCSGPIEYRVRWECPSCLGDSLLAIRSSLLFEADVECSQCGAMHRYAFPEDYFRLRSEKVEEFADLNNHIVQHVAQLDSPDLFRMGNNLFFPILAYLSNAVGKAPDA